MSETAFSYEDWETGSEPVQTTESVLAAGQGVVPARTPIGIVTATGEWKVSDLANNDGSEVATRMTAFEVDTTVARAVSTYKVGTFNPELVNWHTSFNDAVKKALAFVGTPISLQTPREA